MEYLGFGSRFCRETDILYFAIIKICTTSFDFKYRSHKKRFHPKQTLIYYTEMSFIKKMPMQHAGNHGSYIHHQDTYIIIAASSSFIHQRHTTLRIGPSTRYHIMEALTKNQYSHTEEPIDMTEVVTCQCKHFLLLF